MRVPNRHTAHIVVLLGIAVGASVIWILGTRFRNALMPSATITHKVFNIAESVLTSETQRLNNAGLATGKKSFGYKGHVSYYDMLIGGHSELTLTETDASDAKIDSNDRRHKSRSVGRIELVVDLSSDPVIKVYHADTPAAKAFAKRLVLQLRAEYDSDRVPAAIMGTENASYGSTSECSAVRCGIIRGMDLASMVLLLCAVGILTFMILDVLQLWQREPGVYCANCGYDLRGTPGNQCSECGALISDSTD